jgi:hypothetical protein
VQQGNTILSHQKTKKIVTTALSPAISGSNIAKILSISDSKSYDIAEDASQWNTSIKEIYHHAIKYDIMAIFHDPQGFDINNVSCVNSSTQLTNAILVWKNLTNKDYFQWQEFLHHYNSNDNIESDQWMEEFMCTLIAKTLKDKVISDFDELPKEHRGGISLFCCMVNHIVSMNKEPHCNLEKWIQDFTISNIPSDSQRERQKGVSLHQGSH